MVWQQSCAAPCWIIESMSGGKQTDRVVLSFASRALNEPLCYGFDFKLEEEDSETLHVKQFLIKRLSFWHDDRFLGKM